MADRHLAQFSVARLRDPLDDGAWREFLAGLKRVNLLAQQSPGLVWRLVVPDGDVIVDGSFANLSVWESYEALHGFAFRSLHGEYTRRRSRWFERVPGPMSVLWWIDAGDTPSIEEAGARLDHLRRHGPSPRAFSLLRQFDAAGRPRPTSRDRTRRPVGAAHEDVAVQHRGPEGGQFDQVEAVDHDLVESPDGRDHP